MEIIFIYLCHCPSFCMIHNKVIISDPAWWAYREKRAASILKLASQGNSKLTLFHEFFSLVQNWRPQSENTFYWLEKNFFVNLVIFNKLYFIKCNIGYSIYPSIIIKYNSGQFFLYVYKVLYKVTINIHTFFKINNFFKIRSNNLNFFKILINLLDNV